MQTHQKVASITYDIVVVVVVIFVSIAIVDPILTITDEDQKIASIKCDIVVIFVGSTGSESCITFHNELV